jgi:hypothetical protein
VAAKAQAAGIVAAMLAVAGVAHKALAVTQARVVAVSKPLGHRVHVVRRVKVVKGPDVADHPLVTRSPTAMRAVLPVAQWASRVLPARHPVDSLTPCAPASI